MADIPQVLATYNALVGVAVGAGLTYGFAALNRRHQEKREDATCWYDACLSTYADLSRATFNGFILANEGGKNAEDHRRVAQELTSAVGAIRLVGSEEAVNAAERLLRATTALLQDKEHDPEARQLRAMLNAFEAAARKDLGYP